MKQSTEMGTLAGPGRCRVSDGVKVSVCGVVRSAMGLDRNWMRRVARERSAAGVSPFVLQDTGDWHRVWCPSFSTISPRHFEGLARPPRCQMR